MHGARISYGKSAGIFHFPLTCHALQFRQKEIKTNRWIKPSVESSTVSVHDNIRSMGSKSRVMVSEHNVGAQIVTLFNSQQSGKHFYVGNVCGHRLLCEIRVHVLWGGYLQQKGVYIQRNTENKPGCWVRIRSIDVTRGS